MEINKRSQVSYEYINNKSIINIFNINKTLYIETRWENVQFKEMIKPLS